MAIDALAAPNSANALLGLVLIAIGGGVLLWMRDRRARPFLAAYLAVVGIGYLLDGLTSTNAFFPGTSWARFVLSYHYEWHVQDIFLLLDPPLLLLFAIAASGHRLSAARVAAVSVPALTLFAFAMSRRIAWAYSYYFEIAVYYGLAFALILGRYLTQTRASERERLGTLVVAMGIVVPSRLPLVFADLGFATVGQYPEGFPPIPLLLVGALALTFGVVGAFALRHARPENRPHVERTLQTWGKLLVLVALGWVFGLLPGKNGSLPNLLFAGRWFVFAAFFTIWIREREAFDAPRAASAAFRWTAIALVSVLAASEFAYTVQALWGFPWQTLVLYGAAIATICVASYLTFRSIVSKEAGHLSWHRLQIYRAQAEMGSPDDELQTLQARLGLADAEAEEIRRLVAIERALAPKDAQGPFAPGAVLLGRYEVGPLAGAGAFGRIHDATDRITGERVVLKELAPRWQSDAEALARFRREAQTALCVSHPNLVAFRALERVAHGHVLVLARVDGETLAARLSRDPLSSAETARVARDLLAGLAELHRLGIVHRDVKPENIMLTPDGRAVLLDFGCVTTTHETRATQAGSHQPGTPTYMSPEQARGEPVTPASDAYAAGLVLWECLAGAPWPGGQVPDAWRSVLARALGAEPGRRWTDARAFGEAIPEGSGPARAVPLDADAAKAMRAGAA